MKSSWWNRDDCLLSCKDTKLKANHNRWRAHDEKEMTVFYLAKILNWKQITTRLTSSRRAIYCLLSCKDTKLKANHNCSSFNTLLIATVFYLAKILNWKQITTHCNYGRRFFNCLLSCKDTKLKANHNVIITMQVIPWLSFILQRY